MYKIERQIDLHFADVLLRLKEDKSHAWGCPFITQITTLSEQYDLHHNMVLIFQRGKNI